ncbi:MAG: NADH-quinone oxidoreductase subunit I [Deltaproteobacteria bacterium]|nr:NADH-quinone oxidoreductase subunit I [Deltaproteobacteria bacterium]
MREYFTTIYKTVSTIAKGMAVTLRTSFEPKATLAYPDVKPLLPERTRGRLHNIVEDCIGCRACERACPVDCIAMDLETRGPDEPRPLTSKESGAIARKYRVPRFDIDFSLCCWCSLCVFACPTHCLTMTKEYEFSVFDRAQWVYDFGEAKLGYDLDKKYWKDHPDELEAFMKKQAEKKAAEEAKAKAAEAKPEGT